MSENDAELIERARRASDERLQDEYSDYEAGSLLLDLADRLAELTTPELWRSPSEPPQRLNKVWVLSEDSAGNRVVEMGFLDTDGYWKDCFLCCKFTSVTGWKPIVRPLP